MPGVRRLPLCVGRISILRAVFRWLLFALFIAGGLAYLNSAIFHAWVADVPPRLYPEIHRALSSRHLLISVALFVFSGLSVRLLRPKKSGDGKNL
jgi:hypothetical protein